MTSHTLTPPPTGTQEQRFVGFAPKSYDAASRSVDAILSVGAAVRRGGYTEELEISATAVDLARAVAGKVRLLDAHNQYAIGAVLGSVSQCRIDGAALVGKLHFADTEAGREAEGMVARGELNSVSVGYRVTRWEIASVDEETRHETWRATGWELLEVSLVPVPADAAAGIRSAPENTERTEEMPTPPNGDANQVTRFTASEALEFMDSVRSHGDWAQKRARELVTKNEKGEIGTDAARHALLRLLGEIQHAATSGIHRGHDSSRPGDDTMDNPAFHSRAIGEAIYARMSGKEPAEPARQFAGLSLIQLAAETLQVRGVGHVHRMRPDEILDAVGLGRSAGGFMARGGVMGQTTSDFPVLLTQSGNRHLVESFTEMRSPLIKIAHRRSVSDFREITGIMLSGFGALPELIEGSEIKHGQLKERKASYSISTYAEQLKLTRRAIINDDVGAFTNPLQIIAKSSAITEAKIMAGIINGNPLFEDGNAFFSTEHGNIAETDSAPSIAALSEARRKMRTQKDMDGETIIDVVPRFIVSGADLETEIEQLLADISAPSVSAVNPFVGKLEQIVDPRLDPQAWYLFSDPNRLPALEIAYLDGREEPHLDIKEDWDDLGISYRTYFDFGAAAIQFEAGFRNGGAAPA